MNAFVLFLTWRNILRTALAAGAVFALAVHPVAAQERIYFPAVENFRDILVEKINAEMVRIDMSAWYLTDRTVTTALLNKYKQGVPVRLMGDRGSIFEIDVKTKAEFYRLAAEGLPIRLRVHPTWYPEIDHWKATIFVGQNLVTFGSANYTPFELAPASPTNYKDESVLVSDDPELVAAFKTEFDRMWNDTTREPHSKIAGPPYFLNWDAACAREAACRDYATLYPNPIPMIIDTARLEGDAPLPSDMVWGQGPLFNNRLVQEINKETNFIDFVIYRLTVDNITEALLAKHRQGMPIRIILEPNEYRNRKWPEFWITHANMDKLWAAGVPIKKRIHDGLTHMKMLVTSSVTTNASSNLAAAWQRDHNYFVPADRKPAIYNAMRDRFQIMWNDGVGFADFVPEPPDTPTLAMPLHGATDVAPTVTLVWNRAPFATSYAVYLGTSPAAMTQLGTVVAKLNNNPPTTYTWTPPTALESGTTYYWEVVALTNATSVKPELARESLTRSFTTSGPAGPPLAPNNPTPIDGGAGIGLTPQLSWSPGAMGATFNVDFGTSNPPVQAATGLTTPSWAAGILAYNTTYFWRVTAVTSGGTTAGAIWSFTTAAPPPPPSPPVSPTPADGASVGTAVTLTWSAAGATSYDVKFGTANPPPTITTGLGAASYTPASLAEGQTYYWQVVARNGSGTTEGPVWSFTTTTTPRDVVIYASDLPPQALNGSWLVGTDDLLSPNGISLVTPDAGWASLNAPLASPTHYVDVTFEAMAGVPYAIWLRLKALNNNKYNDAVWVQFSDALANGSPVYGLGTTSGLLVNLATDATATSLNGWGWQRGAYWLNQHTKVTFATSGTHTMRIQIREDGVQIDQIVLSPSTYLTSAPGPVSNDSTIVPKP